MDNRNRHFPPPGQHGQRPPDSGGRDGHTAGGNYHQPRFRPPYPPLPQQQRHPYPNAPGLPPMQRHPHQHPPGPPPQQHRYGNHPPPHRYPPYPQGPGGPPPGGVGYGMGPRPQQPPRHPPPSQPQQLPPVPQQQLTKRQLTPPPRVAVKSERPFVVRVKMSGVPLDQGGIPRKAIAAAPADRQESDNRFVPLRTSARTPKRKRQSYADDLEDTDSDVSDDEQENEPASRRRIKKGKTQDDGIAAPSGMPSIPKKRGSRPPGGIGKNDSFSEEAAGAGDNAATDGLETPQHADAADHGQMVVAPSSVTAVDVNQIDAPPPGVLPSLWYSRECVLHVFVIEKILGWKTRPSVKLEFASEQNKPPEPDHRPGHFHKKHGQHLDPVKASAWSTKALTDHITDPKKRMEISRINPTHCPIVMAIAASKEAASARKHNIPPKYKLVPHKDDDPREEVLLIKWRGRSHLHCSWERRRDLEKFDPSNNTARGKIKRYLQSQEVAMGKHWKRVLEEGRASSSHTHHHHTPGPDSSSLLPSVDEEDNKAPVEEEEFFAPECVEVERILACDESEMDMKVLARQRALNLKAEREALRRREAEEEEEARKVEAATATSQVGGKESSFALAKTTETNGTAVQSALPSSGQGDNTNLTSAGSGAGAAGEDEPEEPWDPEDNVRYVVKWKGLQFAEMTWEYWRDIKYDFVDQAEDFWHRQRAPDWDAVKSLQNRPQPHVRDFKKLTVSPVFGVSDRERPVADLGDRLDSSNHDGSEKDSEEGDKEGNSSVALRLRPYQLEGVNWLLWNWWNRRSCILADEMGLGKTIQSVCFLDQLHRMAATQVRGPFLVVAPLSLINQWQSESAAWAPDMNVILYHGSADARDFLVKQEFFYTDQFVPKSSAIKYKRQHITKFHLLITTYEVVLKDIAVLSKISWKALIVDEAHRLKNDKARLFIELATVPREFCLLLTGTPLQNSTEELWSLLHFSDPVAFASKDAFVAKFGQLTDAQQVSDLHSVLKPYLLRRVKEDVEKALPPKEETILEVTLTPIQKTFYKAIYERNTAFLFKGAKPSNAPSLMNIMMELRKCCNHPFLIRGAEERILDDAAALLKGTNPDAIPDEKDDGSNPVDYVKLAAEQLVKSSGKMVLLGKLLPKLQAGGHKVLIFSQMVRVLDLLEDLLRMKRYRYERLDGSTSASSRSAAVDRFHRKSCQRFVMLLSTRAGGLGLNLTAADTVVIFDSDWNPQNDLQAMARAHRIGQTRSVRVYRLLTAKTYEMHMFHSASMKLGLDRAVLAHQRQHEGEDGEDSKSKTKSDRENQAREIDELLKKGAYDVFRDEDDKEAQQFMETDIDQLLEQSSRKVTYGNTTNSSISSGLGSFSKASFVASTGDADGKDVDLDDPDFWEKAVGLEAPAESADADSGLLEGYEGKKRNRKQVQVFDPYAAYAEAEQKKKDKLALKAKQEKDEKERIRQEKKQKKNEEKERKKRERDEAREAREKLLNQSPAQAKKQAETDRFASKDKKSNKEGRAKKLKKAERRKAVRKAEKEDPILERIKQAWEVNQRNRTTSAALRFGFNRFCKIRNESNLTSLPIQDIEVFVRAYIYQLGLQAAVAFVFKLRETLDFDQSFDNPIDGSFLPLVGSCLGECEGKESEWISRAIVSALTLQSKVKNQSRSLRIPLTLAEPSFVAELRCGAAMRALRRFGFLSRLNGVVEDALDRVLSELGQEELGKRGCPTKDLSTLDTDLKARHVSTEEFSHSLSLHLAHRGCYRSPAPWWDRSCDIALIIGTFVHGLGNYEGMRNDDDLPFGKKIRTYANADTNSAHSFMKFNAAASAAKKVFDDALNSAKSKAQAQAHAAVAAAVAASKLAERENERSQEKSATDVSNGSGQSSNAVDKTISPSRSSVAQEKSILGEKQDADTSDVVSLRRLSLSVVKAIRNHPHVLGADSKIVDIACDSTEKRSAEKPVVASNEHETSEAKSKQVPGHHRLPMPDANIMDSRLELLVDDIETRSSSSGKPTKRRLPTPQSRLVRSPNGLDVVIAQNNEVRLNALSNMCWSSASLEESEFCGKIGFRGFLCGSYHRSLDDGSDFALGAASADLASIAAGSDASRYQRAAGVPVLLTRYCLSALVHADESVVKAMVALEGRARESESSAAKDEAPETTPSYPSSQTSTLSKEINPTDGQQAGWSSSVPTMLRNNAKLRSGLCVALLYHGLPVMTGDSRAEIDLRLWHTAHETNPETLNGKNGELRTLFSIDRFFRNVCSLAAIEQVCDKGTAENYIRRVLLPHCLRVCVMGADIRFVRCKGASVAGLEAMQGAQEQSPLPDPCLPLYLHSEDAFACSAAILRRVRIARSVRFLVCGGTSFERLSSFLKGEIMGNLDGLPLWWCPWKHDLALLVHAATYGLFSILQDVRRQKRLRKIKSVFEAGAIERHIYATFIDGTDGKLPGLPSFLLEMSAEDLNAWVKSQATQFPTALVIERRIATICGELTMPESLDETSGDTNIYDNIPMFDHGGWPKD